MDWQRQMDEMAGQVADPATMREIMNTIDGRAFEWAIRSHLRVDGDSDYLSAQYRILRDHLAIGKQQVDFIPVRPEFEGLTAAELDHSIWERYHEFCRVLLHETICTGISGTNPADA